MRLRMQPGVLIAAAGDQLELLAGDDLHQPQRVLTPGETGEPCGCDRSRYLACDGQRLEVVELRDEVRGQLLKRVMGGTAPRQSWSCGRHLASHFR